MHHHSNSYSILHTELAERGARLQTDTFERETLHAAASTGNIEALQYYMRLENFANLLKQKDSNGETPLTIAVKNEAHAFVQELIINDCLGPDLFERDASAYTSVLGYAQNDSKMLALLLEYPGIPSHTFEESELGEHLLNHMVVNNKPAMVSALVNHPGFPRSSFTYEALMRAIKFDFQEVFDVLINSSHISSELLSTDSFLRQTPLLYAIDRGRVAMAIQLVNHSKMTLSILRQGDRYMNTALVHANANGYGELVRVIGDIETRLIDANGAQNHARFLAYNGTNINLRNIVAAVDEDDEYVDYTSDEVRNKDYDDDDDHAFNFRV